MIKRQLETYSASVRKSYSNIKIQKKISQTIENKEEKNQTNMDVEIGEADSTMRSYRISEEPKKNKNWLKNLGNVTSVFLITVLSMTVGVLVYQQEIQKSDIQPQSQELTAGNHSTF